MYQNILLCKAKVCVLGYPTVRNFSPPTLKFFKVFAGISLFSHIVFLLTSYNSFQQNNNIFQPTIPVLKFDVT